VGVFFQVDGEIWLVHPLQSFREVATPFLLPLRYQYCADYHLILCSVKQYEEYPDKITELWRKYGYGVIIIDHHSEPPIKLLDYPLTQFMFPEVRKQIHDYLKDTKNIQFFREPFWVKENDSSDCNFAPAPELLEITKIIEGKQANPKNNIFTNIEIQSYSELIKRLEENKPISLPEKQGLVLYLFKQLETSLRQITNNHDKSSDMIHLINQSYDKKAFSSQMIDFLHEIRKKRNNLSHKDQTQDQFSAKEILLFVQVIQKLSPDKLQRKISTPKPLIKKLLKSLPKQETEKLPYGSMKKELEKRSQMGQATLSYNPFLDSILKKFSITNAVNPKILTVMLLDKFKNNIDGNKLQLEVEECCKEHQPDISKYPLLQSLVG
jgi:hypothetical protein